MRRAAEAIGSTIAAAIGESLSKRRAVGEITINRARCSWPIPESQRAGPGYRACSLRVPAETQIKIISSDFVASTPELARHAITRLRALRLCDLLLDAMAESETEAKRIGAALDFDQDRHHIQCVDLPRGFPMILRRPRKNWSCRKSESETQKMLKFSSVTSPPPASAIRSLCVKIGSWGGMQHQAALPRV